MKHKETCAHGSFVAWGNGFRYDYKASENTLNIGRLGWPVNFASLEFDHATALDPLRYVRIFEKTNQIKALTYSNNTTTDLGRTVPPERISAIIGSTARLSRYAYDLQKDRLDDFSEKFCGDTGLKVMKIKKFSSRAGASAFYSAKMQTVRNNTVSAHGCLIHSLLAGLVEKTLHDLLAAESGHRFQRSAQKLMTVASELATLCKIMDENFIPARFADAGETAKLALCHAAGGGQTCWQCLEKPS